MTPAAGPSRVALLAALAAGGVSCRDLSGFSTSGGSFEGEVVGADFVRSGVDAGTRLCLTLNADRLQDVPGVLSTNDGAFRAAPLRTIPQIWHDPLSTLGFGEGRLKNLVYVVSPAGSAPDGAGGDVLAVVSLMQSGNVEVRILRGAPQAAVDGSAPPPPGDNLFAVFQLQRQPTPCSY